MCMASLPPSAARPGERLTRGGKRLGKKAKVEWLSLRRSAIQTTETGRVRTRLRARRTVTLDLFTNVNHFGSVKSARPVFPNSSFCCPPPPRRCTLLQTLTHCWRKRCRVVCISKGRVYPKVSLYRSLLVFAFFLLFSNSSLPIYDLHSH